MATEYLTDPFIRHIEAPEKQIEVFDSKEKGLALRVTPNRHRSFVFRYRFGGRVKRYTMGSFPALSLGQARKEAKRLVVSIARGVDPLEERKKHKRASNVHKVSELIDEFKSEYLPKKKKSTQLTYTSRIKKIEKEFGDWGLDEVQGNNVRRFLMKIAKKHPISANRVQAIFSKIYSYANKNGYTNNHPIKGLDKAGGREEPREVNYSEEEIRNLWNAFEEESEPFSTLFKVLLLTGQRLGETSRMKWNDIEAKQSLWIIPESETKGSKTHIVPITQTTAILIENLHDKTGEGDFVFDSNRKHNRPLVHFHAAVKRIRDRSGTKHFKIHDLRHIAVTGMISLGIDFVHVGKTVAHKGLAKEQVITSRYAHYEYLDEKRNALASWDKHLQAIINGEEKIKMFKIGS